MISRASWLLAIVVGASAVGATSQDPRPAAAVAVRFHHVHYRVADPGAALAPVAAALGGTRTIVQGVGVGIRVGREYVLFDREDRATAGRRVAPKDAYGQALRWLQSRGLTVQPGALSETKVGLDIPDAHLDHIAFAADDLPAALAAIRVRPLSSTDEAARFRLPSGLNVEIVRDTDRPDAYWCPMHPDVRGPGAGKCARCGMALVPIPPPRIGEYRLDVTAHARSSGGVSGFTLAVRDPDSGERVSRFVDVHERLFHLFVVSRDLETFAHVHPEQQPDGSFELAQAFEPGEYVLLADFVPADGTPQLVHRVVVTPGYSGPLFAAPANLTPGPSEQIVDGLRLAIDAPRPRAWRETIVNFHISDSASGAPVTDLEPYLGASGHLLIVNQDATAALHAHPEGAATGGPAVSFGPVFPAPGRYKLWLQVQRRGRVVTAPFVIDVP